MTNLNNLGENLFTNASNEALSDTVATYRSLKISKDRAILAMKEIDKRIKDGSDFNFIERINETINKIKEVQNATRTEIPEIWKTLERFGKGSRS